MLTGVVLFYLFSVAYGMRKGTYAKQPKAFRIFGLLGVVFLLLLMTMAAIGSLAEPGKSSWVREI